MENAYQLVLDTVWWLVTFSFCVFPLSSGDLSNFPLFFSFSYGYISRVCYLCVSVWRKYRMLQVESSLTCDTLCFFFFQFYSILHVHIISLNLR